MKETSNRLYTVCFHLHDKSRVDKSTETKWISDCLGLGRGMKSDYYAYWVPLSGDENILKLIVVVVAQLYEYIRSH